MREVGARCLFCRAAGPWWDCECIWARKIRDGKIPRPITHMVGDIQVIECADELRKAAKEAGVIRVADIEIEPVRSKSVTLRPENAPKHGMETAEAKVSVTCVVCGKPFEATRSTAQFCSGACRVRKRRKGA